MFLQSFLLHYLTESQANWFIASCIISGLGALYSIKKKSLTEMGVVGAFLVGLLTVYISAICGIVLMVFFFTSSQLTKYGAKIKKKIEIDYVPSGQRNLTQVISNSFGSNIFLLALFASKMMDTTAKNIPFSSFFIPTLFPSILPADNIVTTASNSTFITACLMASIAHYACCCADTWSSEVGSIAKHPPFLITTFKPCPAGTNGGVSKQGLLAGIAGGLCIGLTAAFSSAIIFVIQQESITNHLPTTSSAYYQLFRTCFKLTIFGVLTGTLGTLLDSILGATLQCSVYDIEKGQIHEVTSKEELRTMLATSQSKTDSSGSQPRYRHISGYPILDNHQVNLLSSTIIASGAFCIYFFL